MLTLKSRIACRNFLVYAHQICQSQQICKLQHSSPSSGKHVPVWVLPPLSKRMVSGKKKDASVQSLQYNLRGVYGVMDLAKNGQIEQAELLVKRLEDIPQVKFGVGVCMALLDMHVKASNVDGALTALERLHNLHPDVILQPYKVLSLAALLLQCNQTQKCLEVLRDEAPDESRHSSKQLLEQRWNPDDHPKLMTRLGQQLLLVAADAGDVTLTQRLLDLLINHGYCSLSRLLLAPLVKVHIVRGDSIAALKALEEVAEKHSWLPCKAELLHLLVTNKDTTSLERLMELSFAVIGRPHAMLDLAVTLLECGHLDKAVQILKDEDVTLESERVQYLCKLYVSTRQLQHLQQLCSLARSAACEARDVLLIQAHLYAYYQLAGESQLAQALLTQLQAQNVTETDLISMVPPLPAHLWRDKRVTNVPKLSNSSDAQVHEENYTDCNRDNDIKSKQQSEFRREGRTKPDSLKDSRHYRRGNEDWSVNAPEFIDENHRESNRQFSSSTFSPRGQNKLSQLQNISPIDQDEPSREWDYDAPPYERELCQSMRSLGSRCFPPFNEEQERTKNSRRFSNSRTGTSKEQRQIQRTKSSHSSDVW